MLNRLASGLMAVTLALSLAACATPEPAPVEIRQGVIEQITATQIASNQHQGVGAVVGGLTGVRSVAANEQTKQINVEFDASRVSLAPIEAKLDDEGYPVQK